MVETAAHLIENVIPVVPVRQFVISFPKRIRHYLQTDDTLKKVLRIVVDEIRKKLIVCSPDVSHPQIGAISFIHHFGNTLNPSSVLRSMRIEIKFDEFATTS